MKYKYKIYKVKPTDYPEHIEEEFNRLGNDGWELINVIKQDNDSNYMYALPATVYYFKKVLIEDNITISK